MAEEKPRASDDFKPGTFPELSWEADKAGPSLQALYEYVTAQAAASRDWYLKKRTKKRRAGYALRLGAMLAAALAGIIPILAEIFEENGVPQVNPVWSSVVIALAALLVAIDRLGDMTSGWVRYMLTSQEIAQLEEAFRFDWETARMSWAAPQPSPDETRAALARCGAFLQSVNQAVRDETRIWADEFLTTLREIEKAAKFAAEVKKLGGLNVKVENGDQSKGGWRLRVGEGPEKTYSGKSASLVDLIPGIHAVRVQGKISGKPVAAEKSVTIAGGEIAEVQLTLE